MAQQNHKMKALSGEKQPTDNGNTSNEFGGGGGALLQKILNIDKIRENNELHLPTTLIEQLSKFSILA